MSEIETTTYYPVLKWKLGEYKALSRLDDEIKSEIIPLIIIPPIGYDFEEECLKKTIDEHVNPFPKRLLANWGKNRVLIDIHKDIENEQMPDGKYALEYVFDEIQALGSDAVPVFGFNRSEDHAERVLEVVRKTKTGICFRIPFENLSEPDFQKRLNEDIEWFEVKSSEVDLVIDLGAPESFEPYEDFADLIIASFQMIHGLDNFRSFVIVASGIPEAITSVVTAPGQNIPRHEWILYKAIEKKLSAADRHPCFGDYAIDHPKFVEMDMRFVKPAGKLIYTNGDKWHVRKGPNVRDNKFGQYVEHTDAIVNGGNFAGKHFSEGDEYIFECSKGLVSTGNLTTWKWVAINHHLTQVVSDLSNLDA